MSIIPIQVTLQAANAADYRQLVHDLAGTMPGASAVPAAPVAQAPAQAPSQQPLYADQQPYAAPIQQPYAAPIQQQPAAYPAGVPTSAVPTAPMQQQPMQQAPAQLPVQQQQAVPTSAPQYTQQQLAVAATALLDAGHNVTGLLQQFGVQAITQLPPERYGEFATALRQAGANI